MTENMAWFALACPGLSAWIGSDDPRARSIREDVPTFAHMLPQLNMHMITYNSQDETVTGPSSLFARSMWQRGYLCTLTSPAVAERIVAALQDSEEALVWAAPILEPRNDTLFNALVDGTLAGEVPELPITYWILYNQ